MLITAFPGKKRHIGQRLRAPLRNCLILITVNLLCASIVAGKKPPEFKEGFKALDRSDWREAVSFLRQAVEESPEEDGQRTRIYGSRFERYYPHYYLGKALHHLKCYDEALAQFEESLRAGAIHGKDLEQLLTLKDKSEESRRRRGAQAEADAVPCS